MKKWTQTSKELQLQTFLFRIFRVGFQSQQSGKEGKFDVLESKDWVNIIPITSSNEVILVEQFRFGSGELSLEFPAGAIELGESPQKAAERELSEEIGALSFSALQPLGLCHPNPAFLSNTCHHYLATGIESDGQQNLDAYEEISIHRYPLAEIDALISSGKITHSLSIVAWHLYQKSLA